MTYASEVAADSPVLWWRLGDASGTTAVDASGNGRHGTYAGSPTLGVSGLIIGDADTAVSFDGVDDQASLSATVLSSSATASVELWIQTTDTTAIPVQVRDTVAGSDIRLEINSGATQVVVNPSGTGSASIGGPSLVDGLRHHVVITYNDSLTPDTSLYVDGSLYGTASVSGGAKLIGITQLSVGSSAVPGSFSQAVIDEFAIYGTALSPTRVAAHYAAATPPAPSEVNIDATMPPLVGGLSVHVDTPRELSIDATMPPLVGGLTLKDPTSTTVRVEGVLPALTASFSVAAVIADSQRNRVGAWNRDNVGEAKWSPAVVAPPVSAPPVMNVVAQAYTAPTIDGTHAIIEPDYIREPGHRDRILIAGRDVTYFRGVPTPTPDFQRIQPLLHGAATLHLPQVVVPFETPGQGALSWLIPGASVEIQRVDTDTGEVVATDWLGFVVAFDLSGNTLRVECGGHAAGRAALVDRQMQLVQVRADVRALSVQAIRYLGLRHHKPIGGTPTGIELIRWGGGGMLDYINEVVAKATTVEGESWTIMPDEDNVYDLTLRDDETIHGTVYLDDARVKGDLRRDIAEEPNRIFASGVDPSGMVVKFGAYPGMVQGDAAPYPFTNNAAFGVGTTDADTDTGDGVSVMGWKLYISGFMGALVNFDTYDSGVARAIRVLQEQAGLNITGTMNLNTWRALWNISVTGASPRGIKINPAAQTSATMKWRLSANGSQIARNPNYRPSVIPVDRTIAMGAGFTKRQIRTWSKAQLNTGAVWRGTITITTGAIVAGDHTPGTPVTSILRARDIKPGMNLSLPLFAGGIDVHVAGVSFTDGGNTAMLIVSTKIEDTLPAWAAIQRDRENRETVHRSFNAQRRASSFERENTFDEVGGTVAPIRLNGDNWTVFPVVAKQAGTIERIRLRVSPSREFVVAVFGRKISPARLRRVTNAPLSVPGRKRWTEENVHDRLDRDHVLLYVAGSDEDPCGYYPGRKTEDGNLTGRWDDEAGFPFVTYVNETDRGSVLWVAVWVPDDTTLQGGRIMWPSAEEY